MMQKDAAAIPHAKPFTSTMGERFIAYTYDQARIAGKLFAAYTIHPLLSYLAVIAKIVYYNYF